MAGEEEEIFRSGSIGSLTLSNRLVRSATREGMADPQGNVTAELVGCLAGLAAGGVGLIVTGALFVQEGGYAYTGDAGIHADRTVPGLRRLATRVHDEGGKIVAQLNHVGGQTKTDQSGGAEPVAPSAISDPGYPRVPRELCVEGIQEIVRAFGVAAFRAKEAGFDGVQVHLAHGYLLSEFLSPHRNVRNDEYGGSLSGRMRMVVEVCGAIRKAVGRDYPVLVKMNGEDAVDGGLSNADAIAVAKTLAATGVDGIEVSGGLSSSRPSTIFRKNIAKPDEEGYFLPLAEAIRKVVGVPVISVGGFRSPGRIREALASGKADFIAMARPLVREPDLPKRWRAGDQRSATCISCNACLKASISPEGLHCPVDRMSGPADDDPAKRGGGT